MCCLVGMQGRGPINGYPAADRPRVGDEPACAHAERIGLGTLTESTITVEGPFTELQATVEPAVEDWAIKLMNRVARSPFITKHFLLNKRSSTRPGCFDSGLQLLQGLARACITLNRMIVHVSR